MLNYSKLKEWLKWPIVRAHVCTLAITVSLNATWRVPREAFKYGGLAYGLCLTVAMLIVVLPVSLLQLAIGQLSQQDPVGVWRAVPFFRGIGYIRIVISVLGSAYTSIYVSICIAYFLYTANNDIPFPDCFVWQENEEYMEPVNASECLSITFGSSIAENPEYYIAIALVIVVLWITCSLVFYNSVKLMKRVFYVLGPAVVILGLTTLSGAGDWSNLYTFVTVNDWDNFLEPGIWHSSIVQALWSCQIAGGYLFSAGDSVYHNTNVQWTSIAVVSASIISSWFWLLFWFAVGGNAEKDTSVLAVLMQTYQVTIEKELSIAWPLIVFSLLTVSGIIGLITLLYPLHARLRRIGGIKWRLIAFACSLGGAGISMSILVGRLPALTLIEDIAVPLLICIATVLEILVFSFIYGWKTLVEDVEFLIGAELSKYWMWGWLVSPAVISSFTAWWVAAELQPHSEWWPSWEAISMISSGTLALLVLIICACVAVARQVQYDIIGKLKSSFQPSRHWGPRDPITHYYWLARRDEGERENLPRTRYSRRELGQLSRRPSFLTVSDSNKEQATSETKQRSNSDDWVYTIARKEFLSQLYQYVDEKKRSKSLDWEVTLKINSLNMVRLGKDLECSIQEHHNTGNVINMISNINNN